MSVNKAVILAGGRSSRMGKDKALLPFGGYSSLAEYQFDRLKSIFSTVYISAKDEKFNFNPPLIIDRGDASSPMVALESILESIDEDSVFVLGVDIPFIDTKMIQNMLNEYDKSIDILVAKSSNGIEPLCGIYNKRVLPTIKKMLKENNHRLHTLIEISNSKSIYFENLEKFHNLNRPQDYEKALSSREKA